MKCLQLPACSSGPIELNLIFMWVPAAPDLYKYFALQMTLCGRVRASVYFHSPHGAASAKLLFVHAVLRQPQCVHMHALALGGRLIGAGVKCKSFRDSFALASERARA